MIAHRSDRKSRLLRTVLLAASVWAVGNTSALADDGTPPGCEDLVACISQTDNAPDPTGVDASGDGTTIDSGTSDPGPPVDDPGGSTPVIIIVTTALPAPAEPTITDAGTSTATTDATPATTATATEPPTTVLPLAPVEAAPPPPPPQHGLYCHVVDGVWKMEDLVRDQEIMDPYWTIQGPWQDAYRDPVTGSASCDFPASPAETSTVTTAAPSNTSTSQPAKAVSQPKPPTPSVAQGAVKPATPVQPSQTATARHHLTLPDSPPVKATANLQLVLPD